MRIKSVAIVGAGIAGLSVGCYARILLGLARFHMAGQWAEAMIGVSTAAISGRNAIRRVCREDGQRFVARG